MAFIPSPNGCQVVIETGSSNLVWTNSLWFAQYDFTEAEQEALAVAVFDAWKTGIHAYLANDWQTLRVKAYDMRSDTAPVVEPAVTPDTGSLAEQILPVQDALVVTLYTNTRGRSGRGRLYIAGSTEATLLDGSYTTAMANGVVAMLSNVKAAALALGWVWIIASRYHNGAPRSVAAEYAVQSHVVRSRIPGNQQRRSRRP